jgi:hypothetical protein
LPKEESLTVKIECSILEPVSAQQQQSAPIILGAGPQGLSVIYIGPKYSDNLNFWFWQVADVLTFVPESLIIRPPFGVM